MVFRLLDDQIIFPNTALAEKDGLLAIGGDLSAERLKLAYQSGIFLGLVKMIQYYGLLRTSDV